MTTNLTTDTTPTVGVSCFQKKKYMTKTVIFTYHFKCPETDILICLSLINE